MSDPARIERDAIVAWLEDTDFGDNDLDMASIVFANRIVRGDHLGDAPETLTPSLHQSHKDGIATEGEWRSVGDGDPMGEPDHSGLAQTVELDEATVRACIAALGPVGLGCSGDDLDGILDQSARRAYVAKLEALLPKKDRAKELVDEFEGCLGSALTTGTKAAMETLVAWLESEGKLR